MRKSGKIIWDFMPRTIVPLDSALFFLRYTVHYTALRHFSQYVFYFAKLLFICVINAETFSAAFHYQRAPLRTKLKKPP